MTMNNNNYYESDHGLYDFSIASCQPILKSKRAYMARPKMSEIWFTGRCGFGMPESVQNDTEVWVHEFTENTLASIILEETGRNGLKYKISRHTKENGTCSSSKPTIAHFLTSLTEISAVYNNATGMQWLNADEYFERFLVNATAKPDGECKRTIKYRIPRMRKQIGAPVFGSLPKDMKNVIRTRVVELYSMGVRTGGYDTILSTPWGISERILQEFGIRIWGKTCQRIVAKYYF